MFLGPLIYALLGPLPAVAVVGLTWAGRRKMDRLRGIAPPLPESPPRVTAMVPVRDEAAGIEACLRGLLDQDYSADRLDVVVANDRSTDGTGDILDRLADREPRLRVLHVRDLPAGWLGKPHALHAARRRFDGTLGDWLWLVDSDVRVEADALRRTLAVAEERGYAAVSLLTGLVAPTPIEWLVAPAAAAAWLATFRASETNNDRRRPDAAVANGQFLLIRRAALDVAGGHAGVRDKTCEDVELFRRIKANGGRVRLLLGGHLCRTRMHATPRAMLNGWARNFAGTARHRARRLILPAVFLLASLAAWPAVAFGDTAWKFAGVAHVLAAAAWFALASRASGQSWPRAIVTAVAYPLVAVAVLALLANAARACFGGRVTWRGSRVRA